MSRVSACRRPRGRARGTGFTLLEVLAAVAILGLVYTLLATWAMQGLVAEGEAKRRLAASLLADETLASLEAAIETGSTPPLGVDETEKQDFDVRVDVSPLDLATAGLETEPPATSSDRKQKGSEPGKSILSGGGQGSPSALRRIHVSVTWTEGARELSVVRTTFAFDAESVAPLLEALDAEAAAAGEQAPL